MQIIEKKSCATWLLLLSWSLAACNTGAPDKGPPNGLGAALIVTTDYESGSYSTIALTDLSVHKDIASIHPDAVCRFDAAIRSHFIIERFGADAVDLLNPKTDWRISKQYSVGSGSNPQDIAAVNEDRAYVARLSSASLKVVHPTTGRALEDIDLSAYADEDGIPEVTWIHQLDGKLYVLVAKLASFKPTASSSMLVLEGGSGAVLEEVPLSFTNPSGKLRYNPTLEKFVLIETGRFSSQGAEGNLDGIIELFDPATDTVSGALIDAAALGGDIVDAVILDMDKGYAVIERQGNDQFITELVRFDPLAGEKTGTLLTADGFAYTSIELTPEGDALWLADRSRANPGIRIFDTATDKETTESPINVGLPPFMICFGDAEPLPDGGVIDGGEGDASDTESDGASAVNEPEMEATTGDEITIEDGDCPVPTAPVLTVVPRDMQLTFQAPTLPDAVIQTAVSEAPSGDTPTWEDAATVTLSETGAVKVFARVSDDRCETTRIFSHVYNVRDTLPPPADTPATTALSMDADVFVGFADGVVEPIPFGESVLERWQDPQRALGPPEGTSTGILSLGRGGAVTLTFDAPITDDEGFDFAVFENGVSDDFLELAFVEVSDDGDTFVRFDSLYLAEEPLDAFGLIDTTAVTGLAGKYRQGFGQPFDLNALKNHAAVATGEVDLRNIRYVRLVDVVGDGAMSDSFGHPIYDPFPTENSAGFDLDAVGVIHR